MKKLFFPKGMIRMCVIAVLALALLPGCTKEKVKLPQSLDDFSLTGMWEAVAEVTGNQQDSARLESLHLHADREGNIDSLSMIFHGNDSKGNRKVYFVSMGTNGEINWYSYDSRSDTVTGHPAEIFAEIDNLGLDSLEPGESGLLMQVSFQSGDLGYTYEYADIYHLEGGNLRQLDEVIFHSRVPWCTIYVARLFPTGTTVTVDGQTVVQATVTGPVPPGERTSQIWFLSDDLNRAETVKYLEE